MALNRKRKLNNKPKLRQLTRKQTRKEKRKEKKVKRNEYYGRKRNHSGKLALNPNPIEDSKVVHSPLGADKMDKKNGKNSKNKVLNPEEQRRKEQKQQQNIEKQMRKQRKEQLKIENFKEDQNIKRLEKQLKLHKRKTKSIPKSFSSDGLDYLLEVCDSENIQAAVSTEKEFLETNEDFEEDFALMTGAKIPSEGKRPTKHTVKDKQFDNFEDFLNEDDGSDDDVNEEFEESDNEVHDSSYLNSREDIRGSDSEHSETSSETEKAVKKLREKNEKVKVKNGESDNFEDFLNEDDDSDSDVNEEFEESDHELNDSSHLDSREDINRSDSEHFETSSKTEKAVKKLRQKKEKGKKDELSFQPRKEAKNELKRKGDVTKQKNCKKFKTGKTDNKKDVFGKDDDGGGSEDTYFSDSDSQNSDSEGSHKTKGIREKNADGTWEDIYGRLRSKDGEIISNKKEGKYVPPAVRAKLDGTNTDDKKRLEKVNRLRRQIKGLLNRLAESNIHSICTQIEELYMNNSRNDMNESLTNLTLESLISNVMAPERLLMEHVLLVVILHANIGTEIGAHFLQTVVKKFDEFAKSNHEVENKSLDNTVNILAQLYNFKLFDAKLLYQVLQVFSENFEEKDVECILHILRSVGFNLRKDDPLALKSLISTLQKKASSISDEVRENSRVKFMLEILLAIKNNNVTKIPNYDTSYSEHLKKIMKSFIRKGNYVTQLNISLEDLLKADERGKWWVVGSAWTGNLEKKEIDDTENKSEAYSSKLLELARKQRMNTDTRRNIFCIIMSAEDYLDAFERLLRLGLKNQQEREIIHVVLHCCLQEKVYNPYYAVLAQKFCEYDRKYQMTIKYSVWDKLKTLSDHSGPQISNLAKLLTHLFMEKGLSISTLKIVEFSELDKVTLRFMRQILLGILTHNDTEACLSVFQKVAQSSKLKMFRESLRLFIHHFLLKNLKSGTIPDDQKELLQNRAKIVENVLIAKEGKIRF